MALREINSKELKSLLVEMLKEIDIFCSENGLRYFLAYGTLLGAVRHQGFIPWDDDVDIMMPRSDYQKFIKKFNGKIQSHKLQVVNSNSIKDYYLPYAKVIHTGTVVSENVNNAIRLGVFIDVFPLDNMSDNFKCAKRLFNRLSFYRNALMLKNIKRRNGRSFIKNGIVAIGNIALKILPISLLTAIIDKKSRKYEDKEMTKYLANAVLGVYGEKEVMPSLWFEVAVKLKFEDFLFSVPKEYNNILTELYGDYMQLPPEEKRGTHHSFKAYWK